MGCSIYPLKLIYNPLSQVHHIAYVQLLVFIVIHLLLIRLLVHNPLGQRHHIQHVLLLVLIQTYKKWKGATVISARAVKRRFLHWR